MVSTILPDVSWEFLFLFQNNLRQDSSHCRLLPPNVSRRCCISEPFGLQVLLSSESSSLLLSPIPSSFLLLRTVFLVRRLTVSHAVLPRLRLHPVVSCLLHQSVHQPEHGEVRLLSAGSPAHHPKPLLHPSPAPPLPVPQPPCLPARNRHPRVHPVRGNAASFIRLRPFPHPGVPPASLQLLPSPLLPPLPAHFLKQQQQQQHGWILLPEGVPFQWRVGRRCPPLAVLQPRGSTVFCVGAELPGSVSVAFALSCFVPPPLLAAPSARFLLPTVKQAPPPPRRQRFGSRFPSSFRSDFRAVWDRLLLSNLSSGESPDSLPPSHWSFRLDQ